MGLLSFLKRRAKDAAPAHQAAPASEAIDSVQQARTRARQRLIGAVVLVAAGVIGFPLLFETQPRPLSVNTPIEIARRDADATAGVSSPPAASSRAAAHGPASASATAEDRDPVITETAAEAGREFTPPAAHASSSSEAPRPAAPKPAASRPAPSAAEKKPEAASPPSADKQRAEALLSGQDSPPKKPAAPPSAAADGARFVVQVGAFSDASAAREARQKVEKLGLKTFTQVVDTSAGKRTRVRVGPFPSRAEAEKAAGKLKASGLTSAVLTL